jgi:hypothetical protein
MQIHTSNSTDKEIYAATSPPTLRTPGPRPPDDDKTMPPVDIQQQGDFLRRYEYWYHCASSRNTIDAWVQ